MDSTKNATMTTTTTQPQAVQMSECPARCCIGTGLSSHWAPDDSRHRLACWSKPSAGWATLGSLAISSPPPIVRLGPPLLAYDPPERTAVLRLLCHIEFASTTLTTTLRRRDETAAARGAKRGVPAPQGEPPPRGRRGQGLLPRCARVLHLFRGVQGLLRVYCGHRL